jgi:hypothetical protein
VEVWFDSVKKKGSFFAVKILLDEFTPYFFGFSVGFGFAFFVVGGIDG